MCRLALLLLFLISAIAAEAHLGNENNTEVRVFSDTMRVVIRTSIPFAWNLLGESAPAMADEAGQALARPLLVAAAPGLITVTAGGKPMIPNKVDCVFEVENDVAFVLNFDRPAEWPVVVKALFFDRLTTLDSGTIRVFDYTASRFSRDLQPIANEVIDQRNPSLSFTLAAAVSPSPTPEVAGPIPAPAANPADENSRKTFGIFFLLLAAGAIGSIAIHRWRSISKGP